MRNSKYTRVCKICGQVFDIKIKRNGRPSIRKTCSTKCANTIRVTPVRWSQDEIDYLESIANTMPIARIVKAFNFKGQINNWPTRSIHSISHKLRDLGLDGKIQSNFYKVNQVADLLNTSYETVRNWIDFKVDPLNIYRKPGYKTTRYTNSQMFRRFARSHPSKLGGLDRIGLLILLEDEKLVNEILSKYPTRNSSLFPSKRVICVETKKIYQSQGAAARAFSVPHQCIQRSIKTGCATKGHHFELVDK